MLARSRPYISTPPVRVRRITPRPSSRAELTQEATVGHLSPLASNSTEELQRLYGHVDDIDLTLGWDEKKQMMRDSHVSAAINTAVLGAVARAGEVKGASSNLFVDESNERMAEELAEFCRRNLVYVSQRQREIELTLFQLGTWALVIGNQKAEIVLQAETEGVDAGKLTLARIKSKPRETCAFVVDRQLNVQKIACFTGQFTELREFQERRVSTGATLFGMNSLGAGWEELEREKFLILTHKPPENDSPEGTSALRAAYAPYRMKRNNWGYYLRALDFTALPFLWVEMGPNTGATKMSPLQPNGAVDESAAKVAASTVIYQAVTIARQGGVAVVPNGTKVNAVHNAASGDPHASANSVFNAEITMAILLQLLATGESKHMARAAGQVHQDVLDLVMRYVRRMICGSVSRDVFGLLVRKNFPSRYWHLVPTFSLGEVELNDFAAWALAFAKLNEAGLIHWTQFSAVWEVLGLPQADMDKFLEEIEKHQQLTLEMGRPTLKADGTVEPSQLETYTKQETGKYLTRRASRQIAGQLQSTFSADVNGAKTKAVTSEMVCLAVRAHQDAASFSARVDPDEVLFQVTGASPNQIRDALVLAEKEGLTRAVDEGEWVLEPKGNELIQV